MTNIVKALWRISLGPVYTRLFRRFFVAMISRQNATLGEFAAVRHELHNYVHGINLRLDELNAGVSNLDQQTRVLIAARWDHDAMTRRMAALEDRVQGNGASTDPERQPGSADSP
jgi:hypothetical protein